MAVEKTVKIGRASTSNVKIQDAQAPKCKAEAEPWGSKSSSGKMAATPEKFQEGSFNGGCAKGSIDV